MNAQQLTAALKGRWHGSYGTACCPAHDDRNPSLRIADGDTAILLKCFAGCETVAVIAALRGRGLWREGGTAPVKQLRSAPKRRRDGDNARRSEIARTLWNQALPTAGTPVSAYLESRGITGDIPATIRYMPDAKHSDTGLFLPCMLAGVMRWPGDEVIAVHRTFLRLDGRGKAAVNSPKKMLGPVSGGAVRLAHHGSTLVIAEGIETGMTLLQECGLPVWAALSAGGIVNLVLPDDVTEVVIATDNDDPGRAAADRAARNWVSQGRRVRIAKPPIEGQDFNDMATCNLSSLRRETAHG
jgi:putative DNA primase/helicase